ncbi:MAG: hypothetical protein VX583_01360 [Bdellovibrionota bacterium]|nr:hypothetical protein [Pseudobdellovibrionaceae bacterium]|tara:strand:- start:6588 stop:7046 length:459 start_codon:yes stop_codon:yes gene_type:complete
MNFLDVQEYIPHEAPMIVIDRITDMGSDYVECEVEIKEDSFLCNNSQVPSYLGMEFIAQSIAAFSGKIGKDSGEEKPGIGFLIGIRRYQSKTETFKVGDLLKIRAEMVFIEESLGNFKASIFLGDEELVNTSISTFKPSDEQFKKMKESWDV